MKPLALLAREAYRREMILPRVRWWLSAEGMCDWYRVLARDLEPALGADTRALLSRISVRMFERRWDAMRATHAWLPPFDLDARALPLLMGALYRVSRRPKARWIFDAMGGAAKNAREEIRARVLLARLSAHARWAEMTTHLGELLIVLTEDLPPHLLHARKLLGDICFRAGARFAERAKKSFDFPDEVPDPPRAAMEILRMSEYVFRVNPEHWSASDGTSGYLEGTACPWFDRPGWNGAHCGIFGQFQSGISSVFGLRYHLSKTIPKHGGTTCRIDVEWSMRTAILLLVAACSTPTSTPTPTPTSTPTGTTIVIGGGGAKVTGGPKMNGLSVACAAFQACCAEHAGKSTPPGMACDLAPVMSKGDCSRAVTIVRDSFTAQKTPIPPGCIVLGDLAGAPTSTGRPKVLIGAP